jgi:2-C-methyl-D-erythritol 4-phosphate cytidylyltransferase
MTAAAGTSAAIVVLAAGSGRRVGAEVNKVLLPLGDTAVLAHSVRTALGVDGVHRIVVVVRPEDREQVGAALGPVLGPHDLWLVDGGEERHDSEERALEVLRHDIEAGEIDVVAIHDGARPLAGAGLFATVLATAADRGGAVPTVPVPRLTGADGRATAAGLVAVQTPQAFRAGPLLASYDAARRDGFRGTDTAACLARYTDLAIVAVPGEPANLKVTFAEDLPLVEDLLSAGRGPGSD